MAKYIEQQDYVTALSQKQAEYEAARYEQLERLAEQACVSIQSLADAISQLAAAVSAVVAAQTNDNDARITDT